MNLKNRLIIEKGHTSFCDGHGTRYWKLMLKGVKRNIAHSIETFDNDLKCNDKYHCYVDYNGCIGQRQFTTNNFREAVFWMIDKLRNYI
jgi:hypothetical protein